MKSESILKEVPQVNPGLLRTLLSSTYISMIKSKADFKNIPSVMLWGQPGVGKSQVIREVAFDIQKETGKKVEITDIRLILFNPVDLRGIPTFDKKKEFALWLKPKIFDMNPSLDYVNILFLDEITAAPTSLQAAAYQLSLDRKIGEHELPDNCIVIAAGNRMNDSSVSYRMPKALANRFMHFDVLVDFDAWKKWAYESKISPVVIGFLSFRREFINTFNSSNDVLAFATPRSWEKVSRIITDVFASDLTKLDLIFPLIAGLVGSPVATEFVTFCKSYTQIPDIEEIFDGKNCPVPRDTSALFALCTAMVERATFYKNDIEKIDNSLIYAQKLPRDFGIMLITDYQCIEKDFDKKMLRSAAFKALLNKNSGIINALKK